MNEYTHAAILGLIQGVTEFLPISSSGHLVLLPAVVGWPAHAVGFDVAVHFGTLVAVLYHFRREVARILRDWAGTLGGRPATPDSRLGWWIIGATAMLIPAALLGKPLIEGALRAPLVVGAATAGFGVVLGLADWFGRKHRTLDRLGWRDALIIGAAQILALVPGTSRAGITMSAALALGLTRTAAAHFSFLMAIPVLALAALYHGFALLGADAPVNWGALLLGTAVAAVTALLCIRWLLRFVQRHSLLPFVLYRIALGVLVIGWLG